jgi:hypothetical protein
MACLLATGRLLESRLTPEKETLPVVLVDDWLDRLRGSIGPRARLSFLPISGGKRVASRKLDAASNNQLGENGSMR